MFLIKYLIDHSQIICFIHKSNFLNLTLDVYLKKAKAITSQHAQVLKPENLTKELKLTFVSAEVNTTKHQSANETESFRSKNQKSI